MSIARIVFNADVRTMTPAGTLADAVAWRGERLLAVGNRDDVERAAGPGAEAWDAGGATVLPGFIDAHHHPSIIALYGGLVRLTPPAVTDVASLLRTLSAASKGLPEGQWLVATEWDDALLTERRAPTRAELDGAVGDRPLLAIHYSCHRAVANSRALELAGIGKHTADPSGGFISRGAGGLPDGLLLERGMSRVETLARASLVAGDAEGFLERLGQHHGAMAALGITRVVDATVPGDLATLYREAARRGLLTVPTVMFPVSTSGYLETPWDALEGPVSGTEEGPLTVGPLKLVFDGAPACAMCLSWWQTAGSSVSTWAMALRQRSLDPLRTVMALKPRLGRSVRSGISIYRRDEAREIVRAAADRGFALATHAIGNDAIDVALSAYEAAGASLGKAGLPRIEHATFLDREAVARIAGLGVAIVTQPHFMSLPAYDSAPGIPGLRNAPLRWLLDAGVKVAGSSDAPVAGFDPLDGVRAAVSRRTSSGRIYDPEQRIELHEALAMYTRAAAEACACLDRCGTLEAGKRADIVVLDGALSPGQQLDSARVRSTIIGGELAFGRPSTAATAATAASASQDQG
jgi:predicted amidohydrolase YtcJ